MNGFVLKNTFIYIYIYIISHFDKYFDKNKKLKLCFGDRVFFQNVKFYEYGGSNPESPS